MSFDDEVIHQHPSYGLVQFNRCSSNGRKLFGSAIKTHLNTVQLRIFTNVQLRRGDADDRYYAPGAPDIEVELSAVQFAELVTTMNVGFGVPCTVRRVGNNIMENPPELVTEAEHVHDSFKDRMKAAAKKLAQHVKDLPAKLEAAKVPKKHHGSIIGPVEQMLQEVSANSHFWLEMFEESTEKVVQSAKSEIEAFQLAAIMRAGVKALKEASPDEQRKMLSPEPEHKPLELAISSERPSCQHSAQSWFKRRDGSFGCDDCGDKS